jgi:hypothetical protein
LLSREYLAEAQVNQIFPIIILTGRPASGKSEIIHYLKQLDARFRRQRFYLGELDILDDFPMLWAWFEEDHILSQQLAQPRLHSDEQGYFKYPYLWHVLIHRLDLEYQKRLREPAYPEQFTALIEFSRGSEHGGYKAALNHFSDVVLRQAAVIYVNVTFAESLRKNRRRYNPDRPDSILEHGLSDEKMERLYQEDDWQSMSAADPDYLVVRGNRIPYAVFENADDVTTGKPDQLGERLQAVLAKLWDSKNR